MATTDGSADAEVAGTSRLRVVRAGALVVAILAFLALAALALSADEGDAVLHEGAAKAQTITNVVPEPHVPPPLAPAPKAVRVRALDLVPGEAAAPAAPPAPVAEPPTADEPAAVCSLGLPAPERTGGLASMIALVPAFGSFSAEAFAMAPAYEPVIDLFGGFLPTFADMLAANDAAVAPVVAALRQLSDAGYDTLEPLYGPYRPEVLDGLKALAAALAPYSEQLAASEAGVCLVALEAVLADASA